MRKSQKRDYELDRTFDFSEFWSPAGKRLTKKRAHRRYRAEKKKNLRNLSKED